MNKLVTKGENIFNISTQNLVAGTYIIQVFCANGCESNMKKIIKN